MRTLGIVLSCTALMGCMGEGPADTAEDNARAALAMLDRLDELSPTSEFRVPDSGTATFQGYATVLVSTSRFTDLDDVSMVGESTLEVSYANAGTVTGSVYGLDALVPSGIGQEFRDVSGTIEIGNNASSIVGNLWTSDYEGDLHWGTDGTTVDGNLVGDFLGNRTSDPENPIKGIGGVDLNGTGVTDRNLPADIQITVFGEDVR